MLYLDDGMSEDSEESKFWSPFIFLLANKTLTNDKRHLTLGKHVMLMYDKASEAQWCVALQTFGRPPLST